MADGIRNAIKYAYYPILLAATVAIAWAAIALGWDLKKTIWIFLPATLLSMVLAERFFPLAKEWGMTGKSFRRDLKYLVFDAAAIGLVRTGFGAMAIAFSERHTGLLAGAPVWAAVPIFLLVFEAMQYAFHRSSHSGKGLLGGFLWKAHVAHHLPDRVYVVMHGVFHPLNAAITAAIVQAPMVLLGLPPEAVFASMLIVDLQTTLSHCNVDIRAGWLNYLLVGPELHRRHHSAETAEAGNFGTVLPVWDLVFGTFRYDSGKPPRRLGVEDPAAYPDSDRIWKVLALPFRRAGTAGAAASEQPG